MKTRVCPVILCGGSGKRLWPLSRTNYPKQFIDFGADTLFEQTLERIELLPGVSEPIVVCNEEHRFFVYGLLKEQGKTAKIILEPEGRNTAPAIALAAFLSQEINNNSLLLILPSDHNINSVKIFHNAVMDACAIARQDCLVTFGVTPTRPEKGFGYIKPGEQTQENIYKIDSFIEKPSLAKAEEFFRDGTYFWNSGMFLFQASSYLDELKMYDPLMFKQCVYAWDSHKVDPHMGFIRLEKETMHAIPSGSIDNIVMEKTEKSCMVVLNTDWNDLGSWEAFYDVGVKDGDGNVIQGDVLTQDVKDCYFNTTDRLLCAIGVHDLVVVETEDATLVVDKKRSQEVKDVLGRIQASGRIESEMHREVFRPWGSYKVLISNNNYKVKKIIVHPGALLSLQKHQYRAEHWVVVQGIAHAHIDGAEYVVKKNQSIYIPENSVHRLMNLTDDVLEVIEVQSGSYLGEDDIIRFEDVYGRMEEYC